MPSFLLILGFLVCNLSGENTTFTRTFTWTNYKSFVNSGWVVYSRALVNRWNSPSDMSATLRGLNNNFTDEVWGWKARSFAFNYFILNVKLLPEYCGLAKATINVKYYFSGNETNNFIYPASTSNQSHYLEPIPVVEWQNASVELKPSAIMSGGAAIVYYVQPGELFLLDEVEFTFSVERSEEICPNSCNYDCQYRAIDCFNYYTCVNRSFKVNYTCNANQGLAFNPITNTCDFIENVECYYVEPEPDNFSRLDPWAMAISVIEPNDCGCGYKPHESNCSLYYFCNNTCRPEECEERHCPPGLMWDIDSFNDGSGHQQCVLSENAKCRNMI